jgi:hypothetical protein
MCSGIVETLPCPYTVDGPTVTLGRKKSRIEGSGIESGTSPSEKVSLRENTFKQM